MLWRTQRKGKSFTVTPSKSREKRKFRAFYMPAPAGLFEVKLSVSKRTIKWTPHSAVMFEDTLG